MPIIVSIRNFFHQKYIQKFWNLKHKIEFRLDILQANLARQLSKQNKIKTPEDKILWGWTPFHEAVQIKIFTSNTFKYKVQKNG